MSLTERVNLIQNKIIVYQDENGTTNVSVRFSGEDLWLTELQIAEIYDTSRQNVNLHIANIYKEGELVENPTCKEFLQVRMEGRRQALCFALRKLSL